MGFSSLDCWKFGPTDEQLVGLLFERLFSQSPAFGDLKNFWPKDVDLYGEAEVWDTWRDNEGQMLGHALYFFTSLKKVKKKMAMDGIRFRRKVGTGKWNQENGGDRIEAGNNVVGRKKRFRFEHRDPQYDGGWIMHEFSIDSEKLRRQQPVDIVLCRLKKKKSRKASHKFPESNETNQSPELNEDNPVPIPAQNPNFMSNAEESYTTFDVQGNLLERMTSTRAETDNNWGVDAEDGLPLSTGGSHSPLDVDGHDCSCELLSSSWPDLDEIFKFIDAGDSENVVDADRNMLQPPITTTQAEADCNLVDEYGMPLSTVVSSSPCDVDGDGCSSEKTINDIPIPTYDEMNAIAPNF